MCGIFGYAGQKNAVEEIVRGLGRLEYRGYDSAWVCVVDGEKNFTLVRSVWRVLELKGKVEAMNITGRMGIGHTRWATHGGVTEFNCHPHTSENGRFSVVHNGIIENYLELKKMLQGKGYAFYGETDTEVAAKLFEDCFTGDDFETLRLLVEQIEGAYALVFIDREYPDRLFGAKVGSPLVIGIQGEERYVSSDYRSLVGLAESYVTLEDGDLFLIENGMYVIENQGKEMARNHEKMTEDEKMLELGDFPHFMLKEIYEQPEVLRNVFAGRVDFHQKAIKNKVLDDIVARNFARVQIVASGTSYHAGLLAKWYFEELAGLETDVTVSTEFKYRRHFIHPDTLYIFVSQSGETADTLESLKAVKELWGYTFGVVNVPGSSIARLSDSGLFTHAGVEVGVASTKAFMGQIATFLIMALRFGINQGVEYARHVSILEWLERLPDMLKQALGDTSAIKKIAEKYSGYTNFFYLGRAQELPIAMEGSLKLKELTYRHSEAYSSWELKHGSLALIDEDFPSIIVNGPGWLHSKNCSSVQEVKSRWGKVIGIVSKDDPKKEIYDDVIEFEASLPELNPFLEVVALQLFAYYTATKLERDVDKPRNLAKSVTVE